jgi:hypothetical protein
MKGERDETISKCNCAGRWQFHAWALYHHVACAFFDYLCACNIVRFADDLCNDTPSKTGKEPGEYKAILIIRKERRKQWKQQSIRKKKLLFRKEEVEGGNGEVSFLSF